MNIVTEFIIAFLQTPVDKPKYFNCKINRRAIFEIWALGAGSQKAQISNMAQASAIAEAQAALAAGD
jgi:hypothetical protein